MNKTDSRKHRDRSLYILIFVLLALVAIWATAITAGLIQRNAGVEQTQDEIVRLNQLVTEQTGSLFREIKGHLQILDALLAENPDMDPRLDPVFSELVHRMKINGRIPINIRLVSETGGLYVSPFDPSAAPRVNVADREYFKAQEDPVQRGFYIGPPVLSRVNGIWGIPISYPIASRNAGMFLLLAVIELPQLNELYEAIRPKPSGAISLARADGTMLDRVPFDPSLMGKVITLTEEIDRNESGVRQLVSPIDREQKILAFHAIPHMPLVVSVSISRDDILAEWRARMAVWFAVLLSVTVILTALGLFLWRSWRQNIRNEVRMHLLNEELTRVNEMARLVTENSTDVFAVLSLPGRDIEYVSPSIERNWGWKPSEVIGYSLDSLLDGEEALKARDKIMSMLKQLAAGDQGGYHGKLDIDIPHKDGRSIPHELAASLICDDSHMPDKLVVFARDLTERKANEEIVRTMAFYDRLTGLANRRLLEERLAQLLPLALRDGSKLGILFIDLDRFKPVNDTYGHEAGDWLLHQVAERMKACLRQSDTVARTGGDEFVAVLPDIGSAGNAEAVADKIRCALHEDYAYTEGIVFSISASIGVVLFPDHGKDMRDLLILSDSAMYQAKKSGRNKVVVCTTGVETAGCSVDENLFLFDNMPH